MNEDNRKTRRDTFRFWDLVRLLLEVLWHLAILNCACGVSGVLESITLLFVEV